MNLKKAAFFLLSSLRGQPIQRHYQQFLGEDKHGIPSDTTEKYLIQLLSHCEQHVPYYAELMKNIPGSYQDDPVSYLKHFPILTKPLILKNFEALKSNDLSSRKWYYNTSGGSTGEPVLLIQDWDFASRTGALKFLYSKLVGREVGEPEVVLWGSLKDIDGIKEKISARLVSKIMNTEILSVFRMTPEYMREVIEYLNKKTPKLIVGYASALFEMAKFAQQENLDVKKQNAIISSAYTLHPFMRETIESVFQCSVFDRYGSREVGDIACERPGYNGLWVAPWGSFIEIVGQDGHPVPDGERGEVVVTCLSNYAMPMIRYKIGDMGIISSSKYQGDIWKGQFLQGVVGRSNDDFVNKNGVLVDTGYFKLLLYFRDWIRQYQIIQKRPDLIIYKIVSSNGQPKEEELAEIIRKSRAIMGAECEVQFHFVDEILPSPSGKYRYIISEIEHETVNPDYMTV